MSNHKLIEETAALIEARLDKDLNLADIAKAMGYSKFHLNRLFDAEVGCTMYKYVQLRRLTEAAWALVKTETALTEIALNAHYQSQQAFTKAFRQEYHCSPKEYRQRGRFSPLMYQYGWQQVRAIGIPLPARRHSRYWGRGLCA